MGRRWLLLGVQVLHRSFEEARCQLNVKGEHMNALGGVHGGVIFSLADILLRWLVMQGMRHIQAYRLIFVICAALKIIRKVSWILAQTHL